MKLFYDLHMHTCLSPCGDMDMTPNNLVNMALLLEYDIIAVTDHNSCLNCQAVVEAGKQAGLLVIPGMELCTEEEVHVVCLFPTVERALQFHKIVEKNCIPYPNDPEIFGRQVMMDQNDNPVGEESNLLINATQIGVNQVLYLAQSCQGTAFPAHVDKSAYSVIASLGAIPPEAGFAAAELSAKGDPDKLITVNPELKDLILLRDSDAHYLENIPDRRAWLDLPQKTPECLIKVLNGKIKIEWGL